jgi:hypothetical protein
LGKYTLATITVQQIGKSIEGRWLSTQKTIQLSINDYGSGIKSYDGYLNGNGFYLNMIIKQEELPIILVTV